jgi:RNA polymerase sigma factor (sigma-70 family)
MTTRAIAGLNRLVRNMRRAALVRAPAVVPDGRLLESFLTQRDDAAFAQLVKRHGPMVLGVCTRVIGNVHDAEDAFQAVFLVLARKAGSIVPRDLVGNWLYGVAYRTALQARSRLARRRARERQVTDMPHPTVAADIDFEVLHHALDGELDRLPEKYRVPLVLCDLEGRPRKDVAAQLKIPEGTLSSRLAKGRELLSQRLARHGVVLSGPALALVLAQEAAALQPGFIGAAVKTAVATAAGQSAAGLVSAEVLALSEGVLKTMFLSKLKVISVLVLGVILGGLGAGLFGMPGSLMAPAVAAQPQFPAGQLVQAKADDPEPLDGNLLLDDGVQKELHLSKNQVKRLLSISNDVDVKSEPKQKEIKELQKQIDALNQRIAELNQGIAVRQTQIEDQRRKNLGKAAPDILSEKALARLRQIQRQRRGLDELLGDARIQHMLKIDDEQLKKIETILKMAPLTTAAFVDPMYYLSTHQRPISIWNDGSVRLFPLVEVQGRLEYANSTAFSWGNSASMNEQTLRKLFDVLRPAQQRTLLDWVGEPYPGTSWQVLRTKEK